MTRWWKPAAPVLSSLLLACGHRAAVVPPPPGGAHWDYQVAASGDAATLEIAATFAAGTATQLSVTEGAEPYVYEVRVREGNSWRAVAARDGSWFLPSCASGCEVRYRFALGEAADGIERDEVATRLGSRTYEAPPHAWLLHPLDARADERFRFRVRADGDVRFVSGLPEKAGAWEGRGREIGLTPYSVFGNVRVSRLDLGKSSINLAVVPSKTPMDDALLSQWILRATGWVRDYFGAFPIDGAMYVIVPVRSRGVGFGRTTAGAGGGSILIDVGTGVTKEALYTDWVAVHESVHLAFPSLPRDGIWLEEGLATYLETVIRARAGVMSDKAVWHQFFNMMPNGLPEAGDRGLDHTHTWGRIYWGGALFFMLADVEIRKRSQGARSLQDALRGILRAGGNDSARWTIERTLEEGDRAAQTHVLRELHASMGAQPVAVDLGAFFRELGVQAEERTVSLSDAAPLAPLRKAIVTP